MAPKQRESPNIAIDGAKLKHARHLAGLGQTPLGAKAAVSQSYISSIEDGKRTRVSPEVYARLCDALDITDRTTLMTTPPATPTP